MHAKTLTGGLTKDNYFRVSNIFCLRYSTTLLASSSHLVTILSTIFLCCAFLIFWSQEIVVKAYTHLECKSQETVVKVYARFKCKKQNEPKILIVYSLIAL